MMSNYDYDEKSEEKEMGKHDEKEEKSYEEKYREDPVGTLVWAGTLIWLGLVLLANNLGWLERLRIRATDLPFDMGFDPTAWTLFFLGAGVLVLVGVLIRLANPSYRQSVVGNVIWAIVLFGIALGSWELIWPLVLIAIGISMLFNALFRR